MPESDHGRTALRPHLRPTLAVLSVVTVLLAVGCDVGAPAGPGPSSAPAATSAPTGQDSQAAQPSAPASTPQQRPSPAGPPSCREVATELTVNERIGQVFMAGTSSEGMSEGEGPMLSELNVGSLVLLGNTAIGKASVAQVTDRIRTSMDAPPGVETLIAADQEGGQVQRLSGPGFSDIPSASGQSTMSDRRLRREARGWGEELKQAGVDANLAPVADVVPKPMQDSNEPIAQLDRGYGSDPQQVAAKNVAFISGMHEAGIATSLKHFPGLGRVRGNTDFSTDTVDRKTTAEDPLLAGFGAGIDADSEMVMMSSATYTKIDPDRPALYSPKIIKTMLRKDLGFSGVVISDDLSAEALAQLPPGERALRFLRAGGDLAIVGDFGETRQMVEAVREAAAGDKKLQDRITDASTKVLIMKSAYGLASCSKS